MCRTINDKDPVIRGSAVPLDVPEDLEVPAEPSSRFEINTQEIIILRFIFEEPYKVVAKALSDIHGIVKFSQFYKYALFLKNWITMEHYG